MNSMILYLIIAGCSLVLSIGLLFVFFLVYFKQSRRTRQAVTCVACGYPRTGIDSATCPECGGDWGEASNWPQSPWVRLMLIVALVLLIFLVLPAAALVTYAIVTSR